MFVLSKIAWIAFSPDNFLLLLLVVGGLAAWLGRSRRLRRAGGLVLGAGIGCLMLILVWPDGKQIIRPLENRFPALTAADEAELSRPVRGIIVLGGAENARVSLLRNQPILNDGAERHLYALALARRHPEALLIFTGGSGLLVNRGGAEAEVARALHQALGVDPARTRYESASRNTVENAGLTLAMLRAEGLDPTTGTWLLVTSAWHMPRAVGVFRKAGYAVVPCPTDFSSTPEFEVQYQPFLHDRLKTLVAALREYVGLVAYRVMGRIDDLFPAPALPRGDAR